MPLTMVTLTGRYETATGAPETGTVTFTPSTTLQSATSDLIIQPAPVTATLDNTGSFSVSLLATDAATVAPSGWTYTVAERLGPTGAQVGRTFSIALPGATSPVDLSNIAPVAPAGAISEYGVLNLNNTWTGTNTFSGSVALNGGVTLASALPITQGGTGSTSANSARTALGLGTSSTANIDVTNTDIQALGTQSAGSTGQVADAGHVHPMVAGATTSAQGIVQLAGDLAGTATSPQVTSTHLASALPIAQGGTAGTTAATARTGLQAALALVPTAVKTNAYTAAAGDLVPVDTTTGAITITLPTAPADRTVIGIKMIASATTPNAVTFATGGSDVINKSGGPTSGTLTLLNQGVLLQYSASSAIWYVEADDLPLGQLDLRYQKVTVVATATGVQATDAANIATAVTAAGTNGAIYFPYGTYVADSLAPLSGQTWYGPATIQRPNSSTNSVITATGISNFTMRDLTVDGNRSNSTASSNAAIYLINTTWTRIQGITVQNTPSTNAGIILRGSVRGLVADCQLTNVGYAVLIGLNHGDSYSCYGSEIRGCTIDTTDNDAIFLSENLGSTTGISVTGSVIGTVVTGCTVRNFGDCGIEVGSGTVYTQVSGCTFVGISNGSGNNGVLFRDSAHGSVTGCTVSNLTKTGSTGVYCVNLNSTNSFIDITDVNVYNTGYGYIAVGGTSPTSLGTSANNITISGGTINSTGLDGIHLNNVAGFAVTGTTVYAAGNQGISLGKFSTSGSSATDGTITGCRIFNSSQTTTGDSGIIAFQSSSDITITGCRIGDNQGTKTQAYGIRLFDTTVSNVTISNTDLTNGGTTSNFASAPAMGSGIQVLNCIGISPASLPNVTTQPGASVEPSDHGLIAWSYDPGLASQSSTTVSGGTLYLTAVYPRVAFNSSKVYFSIATAGVTPTTGDNWIGLYNTSGTLLASKEIDSNVTGVGLQTITWTSATGAQPAGLYWVGFYFNAATEPTLYRAPTPADNATQNVNLTTSSYRMCQQAGGFTTALPSPLTVSSNSISGSPRLWWVALG